MENTQNSSYEAASSTSNSPRGIEDLGSRLSCPVLTPWQEVMVGNGHCPANINIECENDENCAKQFKDYKRDLESERCRLRELRKWQYTRFGNSNDAKNKVGSTVFTIVSYNILAQSLLEFHAYLYSRNDPRALPWSHRVSRLLDEIRSLNAEIICLQELQFEHVEQINSHLEPLNYKYIYKKRTGSNADGSAIFYRNDMFTLIDHKLVEYFRPNNEILSKDNVGVIAKLKVNNMTSGRNGNDNVIIIATTHLLYNPKRSDVRLAQVKLMLAELDRMAYIGKNAQGLANYLPVILTGDFNLQPDSAVYNLLTQGSLEYSKLSERGLQKTSYGRKQGTHLVPSDIGVTDTCQFIDTFISRNKGTLFKKNTPLPKMLDTKMYVVPEDMSNLFNSGMLYHALNLTSAYRHFTNMGQFEASTFQEKWVTVDYIFYSRVFNQLHQKSIEGRLKLISRFSLPTINDCQFMGPIPNLFFGSDHLALAAKFMLKRF